MGYVAVQGGTEAIEQSIERLKYERLRHGSVLALPEIEGGIRALIDQVMSESSLYSETLAALAIKQAEGSPEEAVFLLRAYRSTLPRNHYPRTVHSEEMLVERRISASFKEIPGGQILGATTDFMHRLLDFDLAQEESADAYRWLEAFERSQAEQAQTDGGRSDLRRLPKVLDYLRAEGLLTDCEQDDREPDDVTRSNFKLPSSRSERLQILTRGQTGAMTALAYAVLRGYGQLHPTVGELRVGALPVTVDDPLLTAGEDDAYYIGDIKVTEVEMLMPVTVAKEPGKNELQFEVGYGICYGQNETKAIAMSILDNCLEHPHREYPSHNEEFVLFHIDSVEATGFVSHLKMPHYVTFQSKLDSMRKTVRGGKQ